MFAPILNISLTPCFRKKHSKFNHSYLIIKWSPTPDKKCCHVLSHSHRQNWLKLSWRFDKTYSKISSAVQEHLNKYVKPPQPKEWNWIPIPCVCFVLKLVSIAKWFTGKKVENILKSSRQQCRRLRQRQTIQTTTSTTDNQHMFLGTSEVEGESASVGF